MFVEHYVTTETSHPGRMAPNTALNFLIFATTILIYNSNKIGLLRFVGALGSLIFGMGLVALIGYFVKEESVYGWGSLTDMALHTAVGFMILGFGCTVLSWRQNIANYQISKLHFPPWLFGYALSFAATIFLVDSKLPLGFSAGNAYILLILFGWFVPKPRITIILAIIVTILTILGYMVSPEGADYRIAIANRAFSILIIWLTAFMLQRIKKNSIILKATNNSLDKRITEIEEKNKVLEQFTYIASHDLQEPLRTVSSFTDLLINEHSDSLDETGKKSIHFIQKATERMSQLVKGLLDYSRLGAKSQLTEVDLNDVITNVKSDLQSLINSRKALIKSSDLPIIKAYRMEMRLLFQNLISNSIKYSHDDISPEIEISFKDCEEEDVFEFALKDNGIGMEESQTDRIFSIFQRLHGQNEYEGTGIGLAHCRRIVSLHEGSIWVKSKLNYGSTFFFQISKNLR